MYRFPNNVIRVLSHRRPSHHSPLSCNSCRWKTTAKRQKKIVVVKRELPTRQRAKKPSSTQQKTLFRPVDVVPEENGANVGEELVGKLSKVDITRILKQLIMRPSTRVLASQHGLDGELFENALQSFRRYCLHVDSLPVELHIVISDILADAGHVDDLFPFFLTHSKEVYPHLECMEDLKKISDLTEPPNWYPLSRSLERKIIFHCGPTNSGKTYHALNQFLASDSGVYSGPLRLLAMEVYDKSNQKGTPCDLVTGETRRFANGESPSNHVSCTVEMMNVNQEYDVAVIDEIQMIADPQRGSAWTRALLGVAAREVHVCGEETALELVESLMAMTGDTVEVRRYERLTKLEYETTEVGGFDNIRPGDCIVCFKKADIFRVCRKLDSLGYKCAVIYGGLPPGTKIMQSKRFNDPDDPCNVLVATDAVGMGLNLAIKRVIFYSLLKPSMTADGTIETNYLTTSQAQQIGGRAGRYRTQYEDGQVTTFLREDNSRMHKIVSLPKEPLKHAGLNPTADQLEMFAYHLPKSTLSNLLDIFEHVCQVDDTLYFMCNYDHVKELADLIEHLPIPLRTRFTFCSAPMKVRRGLALAVFIKMAREFSRGQPLTFTWLCAKTGAPFSVPRTISELEQLEAVFQVVDIYLWLGFRYPDMFRDIEEVRELRVKIDSVIHTYLNSTQFVQGRPKTNIKDIISGVVDDLGQEERTGDDIQNEYNPEKYLNGDKEETKLDPVREILTLPNESTVKEQVLHCAENLESQFNAEEYFGADKETKLDRIGDIFMSPNETTVKEPTLDKDSVTLTDEVVSKMDTESQMSKSSDETGEVDSGSRESSETSAGKLESHEHEVNKSGTNQFTKITSALKHKYTNLKFVKSFNKTEQDLISKTDNAKSGKIPTHKTENLKLYRRDMAAAAAAELEDILEPWQHNQTFPDSGDKNGPIKSRKYPPIKTVIHKQKTTSNGGNKPFSSSNTTVDIHSYSSFSDAFKNALTKVGKGTVISHDGNGINSVQTSNKTNKARKIPLDTSALTKPGILTERLLQEGLLSKDMLEKLKKEWELEQSGTDTDGAHGDEQDNEGDSSSTTDIGSKTNR